MKDLQRMLLCWRYVRSFVPTAHRRAAAVRSAATVCYKRITADQAETRYTMLLFLYFGHVEDGKAKSVNAMAYYCWQLMPRNGLAERRAVRRQAVLAVRFRRLCENGTAAARLFAV